MKQISVLTNGILPDANSIATQLGNPIFDEILDRKLDDYSNLYKHFMHVKKRGREDVAIARKDNVYSAQIPLLQRIIQEGTGEHVEMMLLLKKKIGAKILKNAKVEVAPIPAMFNRSDLFIVKFAEDFSYSSYKFYYLDLRDEAADKPNLVMINKFTGEYEIPGGDEEFFFNEAATHYKCELAPLVKNCIWVYSVKVDQSGGVIVSRHLFVYLPELRFVCEITERLIDQVYFTYRGAHRNLPKEQRFLMKPIQSTHKRFQILISAYNERLKQNLKKECKIILPPGFSLRNSSLSGSRFCG